VGRRRRGCRRRPRGRVREEGMGAGGGEG